MSYWIWMCSEVSTVEGNLYLDHVCNCHFWGKKKKKKSDIMEQNV